MAFRVARTYTAYIGAYTPPGDNKKSKNDINILLLLGANKTWQSKQGSITQSAPLGESKYNVLLQKQNIAKTGRYNSNAERHNLNGLTNEITARGDT